MATSMSRYIYMLFNNRLKDAYLRESASASVHGIRDLFFLFVSAIKVDTRVFSSLFFCRHSCKLFSFQNISQSYSVQVLQLILCPVV